MTSFDICAPKLMQSITLRVTGLKVLSVRLWIAARLFTFGAWVAGCNIEIEAEDRDA